jgi:hypothetical protein
VAGFIRQHVDRPDVVGDTAGNGHQDCDKSQTKTQNLFPPAARAGNRSDPSRIALPDATVKPVAIEACGTQTAWRRYAGGCGFSHPTSIQTQEMRTW